MKTILGLDLGTNSIGWAIIEIIHDEKLLKIITLGSRIIPMDSQELSKFNAGSKINSAAANRTKLHRARITKERYLLRRDRLHLVLNLLEALPEHYKIEIDFERNGKKCGQFRKNTEPKIAYSKVLNEDGKYSFYFENAFNEMVADLQKLNPSIKNEKGKRVPKDWTIYFLRNKALKEKISLEELAWVLLSYNQKRGYEQIEVESEIEKSNEIKEILDLKVINVENKKDMKGEYFEITLNDAENFCYKEYSSIQLTEINDIKEVIKTIYLDDDGNIIPDETSYKISDLYELELEAVNQKETDDKTYKFRYDFIYKNKWVTEKKSKKFNKSFNNISKKLIEIKNGNKENLKEEKNKFNPKGLYIVDNTYDIKGNPKSTIPNIKVPDFSGEKSKDWTLLKKKTEKDTISFNINAGYKNDDGSAKHYISPKIYDVLKNDAKTGEKTKIVGGLFQTIDRKYYREELLDIIETQRKFHNSKLDNRDIFEKCVKLLYPNNADHSKTLLDNKKAIAHLLTEDILLYQRPLKSKKSDIGDCKYEIDYWKEEVDTHTGEIKDVPVYKKAVSTSHPLYQEYRIWDRIHNFRLIQVEQNLSGNSNTNVDVTKHFFKTNEDYKALFEYLHSKNTIKQGVYLQFCKERFGIDLGKKDSANFVWNYPPEEEFKVNETKSSFEFRFKRCGFNDYKRFLTLENQIKLWHYLNSVNYKERNIVGKEGKTSIQNFFAKFLKDVEVDENIFDKIVNDFSNYPKFPSKYGAFSEKALKKLLTFMKAEDNFLTEKKPSNKWEQQISERVTTLFQKLKQINWNAENINYDEVVEIHPVQKNRKISFPKGIFNTFKDYENTDNLKFLNLTKASYLVYGRHSELATAKYWKSPNQIREGIVKELKYNSLNNPVAEKVLKEMMRVVADLWEHFGNSSENYFDKINIEVARELQKSNKEKAEITTNQKANKTENDRLRSILEEFLIQSPYNAKVGNQDHFERLKIMEDGAKNRMFNKKDFDKDERKAIISILNKQKITKTDFEKYKLWIEQGYRSPYTGKPISLSNLFNGNLYNIDHILPRAVVTNDSLNNKVVCEAVINRLKSNMTGRTFVASKSGVQKIYDERQNKEIIINIITEEEYVDLVKKQFTGNKKFILLAKEIPDGFTNSQLNNAKHIARKAMELLSHIVREEGEVEFRSKNVLPVTGTITDKLKKEWKFNEIWSSLLTPRFERLNSLYKSKDFGDYELSKSGHSYFNVNTKYILEYNKNFELKRLDHRHHALDALAIALCTENHIQYFNNVSSGITTKKKDKIEAIKKQRAGIKRQIMYTTPSKEDATKKEWKFLLPGAFRLLNTTENAQSTICNIQYSNDRINKPTSNFKNVILNSLEHCIVTFKNDFKLVAKTSNKYESYYSEDGILRLDNNGKPQKGFISQKNENNKHWSIKQPLHKDAVMKKYDEGITNKEWINNLDSFEDIIDHNHREKVRLMLAEFEDIETAQEIITIKNIEANNLLKDIIKLRKKTAQKKYCDDELIINELSRLTKIYNDEYEPYTLAKDYKILKIISFNGIKFKIKAPIEVLANRDKKTGINSLGQMQKKLMKVADEKIRTALFKHLEECENDIDIAFSIEGIADFNKKRKDAKMNPLKKIIISESGAKKFAIGKSRDNKHKWVETGGNFHFKIIKSKDERKYQTITLREDIEIHKQLILNPDKVKVEDKNTIILSPNDLVFVPNADEINNPNLVDFSKLNREQCDRIYTVNDFSSAIYFSPINLAKAIIPKEVDMNYDEKKNKITGSFDTKTASINGVQIKEICWKLETNRLGKIIKVIR